MDWQLHFSSKTDAAIKSIEYIFEIDFEGKLKAPY